MSARIPWAIANYPSKPGLSQSEAMDVLRRGPHPDWFRPWAEHARVAPNVSHPWGYIHIHNEWGGSPVWEVVGFWSPEDLADGLKQLFAPIFRHSGHDWYPLDVNGYLNDHECHGVFYWLPTDPHMLRLPLGVTL